MSGIFLRLLPCILCVSCFSGFSAAVAQDEGNDKKPKPVHLAYVPSEVQQMQVFRPAAILNNKDVVEFKRMTGPAFDMVTKRLMNQYFKFSLTDFDEIDFVIQANWRSKKNTEQGRNFGQYHNVLIIKTLKANEDKFDMATHNVASEFKHKGKGIFRMKKRLDGQFAYACILDEKTIAWSSRKNSIETIIDSGKSGPDKSPLLKAWSPFADRSISFAVRFAEEDWQYAPGNMKQFEKLRFVAGGVKPGKYSIINGVCQCDKANEAQQIKEVMESELARVQSLLDLQIQNSPDQKEAIEALKDLAASMEFRLDDNQIQASGSVTLKFEDLVKPLQNMFEAQDRTWSLNHSRQNAIAMLNFESAYGHLPKSVFVHESGKEYSWRIAILPFIEQQEIYDKYDFTQDWNSPHNLEVTSQMPDCFRSDNDDPDSVHTSFFMLTGPGGLHHSDEAPTFSKLTDGSSNTILAVQAKRNVHWAKPEDIEIHPDKPLPDFGGFHEGGFVVTMVDGSTRFISEDVEEDVLRDYFTPAGGEIPRKLEPPTEDKDE